MDGNDVVELLPVLCIVPLFVLVALAVIPWGMSLRRSYIQQQGMELDNIAKAIQNQRAILDLDLVPTYNGVHKMYVARSMFNDEHIAAVLTERAIETTRAKPLDRLQTLNYAPRIAGAEAQANADMQDAMSAIDGLLDATGGELDMHVGSNGNGKH